MAIEISIFSLLLIFLNSVFSLKYIIIPFEVKKFDYKYDKRGMLHNLLYKDIMINISIGNPKQKIPLLAGMGEYSTYVISNQANDFEGGTFNKKLSKTYYTSKEINEVYSYQSFNEAFPSSSSDIGNDIA